MKKRRLIVPIAALLMGVTLSPRIDQIHFFGDVKKAVTNTGTKTLIIDGSQLTSTATSGASNKTYTDDYGDNYTISFSSGAKTQSSSGDNKFTNNAILIGKSGANIHNTTSLGKIKSFQVYANKGASAKVSVGINFSSTVINSYNSNAANTWTETLSTLDHVYDCSSSLPSDASYFYYQVTNANNSQVEFKIEFETHYTVSFKGEGVESFSKEIQYNTKITDNIPAPSRDGYSFDGWFKKDNQGNFTEAWDFENDTVTENITLYAKWTERVGTAHLVSFEIGGEEYGTMQELYDGESIEEPATPDVGRGKRFIGWYEDELFTKEFTFPKVLTAEDEDAIIIYGKVEDLTQYTVNFYIDDELDSTQTPYEGETVSKPNDPSKEDDEKYSYEFIGWFTAEDVEYVFSSEVSSSFDLYAKFKKTKLAEQTISSVETKVKLNYTYGVESEEINETETITFNECGYENGEEVTEVEGNRFQVSFAKASGNNAPKYYDTGEAVRAYGGNTFTVSSELTITSIELSFASGEGNNSITVDDVELEENTWTGSSKSVTFTISGTSGHRRIACIKAAYSGNATSYTFSNVNLNFGAIVTKKDYNDLFDSEGDKKIGVAFARKSKIVAASTTLTEAFKNNNNLEWIGKQEVNPEEKSPVTTNDKGELDNEGTHYSWSVTLQVPTADKDGNYTEQYLTEQLVAVAYMYDGKDYVFFGEREMSVSLAAKAYQSHTIYTNGTETFKATIDYLASLKQA